MKAMKSKNALRMISLNIEVDRHFDLIFPFFEKQTIKPDIILLQEVLDKDIQQLEQVLGMKSVFAPITFWSRGQGVYKLGMATFSSLPMLKVHPIYYNGDPDNLPTLMPGRAELNARALLVTEILNQDESYCFINTHFTWTPDGNESELQRSHLRVMLSSLQQMEGFVLCGDFNAPRGKPIFDTLAAHYKDNIPAHITSTIDKNLHKAGDLNLMVDGLFTTPEYRVDSIEIIDGLSDHCAVLANIQKVSI